MKPCSGRVIVGFEGFQINGMGLKLWFFVIVIVHMQPCLGRVIVGSRGFQIHENWGLDELKIIENRGLEGLGAALGAFWRSLRNFG